MTSLTEFVLSRIAEDEATARAAFMEWQDVTAHWETVGRVGGKGSTQVRTRPNGYGTDYAVARTSQPTAAHIARHDPARVLAQCAALREIVALYQDEEPAINGWAAHQLHEALRALASIWADHEGFDPAWWLT